jgi:hypothetical protein
VTVYKSITIKGATYGFDHLVPMKIDVGVGSGADARTLSVLINFSCHCFTDKLDPGVHTPDYHYIHEGDQRAFSHSRYTHSLGLPDILKAIERRRVYFTRQSNYVLVETVDENGVKVPYTVFFDVKKGSKGGADVVMTVVSAYVKPDMTTSAPTIRFATLVGKTFRGEKPTATSPQQIKK